MKAAVKSRRDLFLFISDSKPRHFSTQSINNNNKINHGEDERVTGGGGGDNQRSTKRSHKSKSMAMLINFRTWSGELEATLSSIAPSLPLSKTMVMETLRHARNSSNALEFFDWASRTGFCHDEDSYFSMLGILGRSGKLNAARTFLFSIEKKSNGAVRLRDRFFNSLIRSFGDAGLFNESLKVFTSMKSLGVSPSVRTFNSLFLILLKRGKTNMIKGLFDEMLHTYGVFPDNYTFNILIRGYCKNSMVDEGFRYFNQMVESNCSPDVVTYNTLIDGLCRVGKVKIADNVMKGMDKKDVKPDVVTYTTLLRGYCMKQDIDEALVVFQEMVSRGLKPNDITYNTLIKGLCEAKKVDKIGELLDGALSSGRFTPDVCTYNTLMNTHCEAGKLDKALKVFEKMIVLKAQPDSASYSVLIRSLCQNKDFDRAEKLFDELFKKKILLRDDGCTPVVASYSCMFEFLCKSGKTYKADRVFRQLIRRGRQDPTCYKTLIMGHCREGAFETGYEVLLLMLKRDYLPEFETYQLLIDGLLQKGEPVLAQQTIEKMVKSGYLPTAVTFHSILGQLLEKGRAREAANFVKTMLDMKIRQNINLSTETVRLMLSRGHRNHAYQTTAFLYDNGYKIDMEKVMSFLCQSGKLLDAQQMMLFWLDKASKHHMIDIGTCNTIIEGLCKKKKLSEAFELFVGLADRNKHRELICAEDLAAALNAKGKVEEANFVSKRTQNQWQSAKFLNNTSAALRP
ncbi:Pentatricopeptide repeat-containing protein At1g02060, chloroplastic [Linum grandiflorum]